MGRVKIVTDFEIASVDEDLLDLAIKLSVLRGVVSEPDNMEAKIGELKIMAGLE